MLSDNQIKWIVRSQAMRIFWTTDKYDESVESCVFEVFEKARNAIHGKWDKEARLIIKDQIRNVLWNSTVDDLWIASVDIIDSENKIWIVDDEEYENINLIIKEAIVISKFRNISIFDVLADKLPMVATYFLKINWFSSPLEFFTFEFENKIKWDFWIFGTFSNLFEQISWKTFTKNISKYDMYLFVCSLKYKRNVAVMALKKVRNKNVKFKNWESRKILYKEDLEEIWFQKFSETNFYKWVTGHMVIEFILWKTIDIVTEEIYKDFINIVNFVVKKELVDNTERLAKSMKEGFVPWEGLSSNSNVWYMSRIKKQNSILNAMSDIEKKEKAIEVLKDLNCNNIFDIVLFEKDLINWKVMFFWDFKNLYLKLIWKTYVSNIESLNKLSDFLWWKSLDEYLWKIINKEFIKTVSWITNFLEKTIYINEKDNSQKIRVFKILKFYLWKNNNTVIDKKNVEDFLKLIKKEELYKKFKESEDYAYIKRPKEFVWMDSKSFYHEIVKILKKEENCYESIFDLLVEKRKNKFRWIFAPFSSFENLLSCSLEKIIVYKWITIDILEELIKRIGYDSFDVEIVRKLKKTEINLEKLVISDGKDKIVEFWKSVCYTNKSWESIKWIYVIKSYTGVSNVKLLSIFAIKRFIAKLEKISN
jgi:hypothetical protein